MDGSTTYTDDNGVSWGVDGDPFQAVITTYEPTGGVIEGSFSLTVTHGGNAAYHLEGTFHVCHVQDLLAPWSGPFSRQGGHLGSAGPQARADSSDCERKWRYDTASPPIPPSPGARTPLRCIDSSIVRTWILLP